MCQYVTVIYTCGHRHHVLEISNVCYHVDAKRNCSGCCEPEKYDISATAMGTHETHQSDFLCPACRKPNVPQNTANPIDKFINQTNMKAKEAVDRGMVWAKFRHGEKKTGGVGKIAGAEPTPVKGAKKKAIGDEDGRKKMTIEESAPAEVLKLEYGGVKILKRNLKNKEP
jgi:hypothetical protein